MLSWVRGGGILSLLYDIFERWFLEKIVSNKNPWRNEGYTVCPRSSDPFYVVTYYINWVTTSWTYCRILLRK